MTKWHLRHAGLVSIAVLLLTAACSGGTTTTRPSGEAGLGADGGDTLVTIDPNTELRAPADIRIKLAQQPSARYVGVFQADIQGAYEAEALSVTVEPPNDDSEDPVAVASAPDGDEFLIAPAIAVMRAREEGSDLVNIAQLLSRSGQRIATRPDGPASLAELRGSSIGLMGGGYGYDIQAALASAGVTSPDGVTLSGPPLDLDAFTAGTLDAVGVRYEDEVAQVWEGTDPTATQLPGRDSIQLIDLSTPELATLQDGVYARAAWLAEGDNADVAVRFLRALLRGMITCREALEDCAQLAYESGGQRGAAHQAWVLNETNKLIWPAPAGIGTLDAASWGNTAALAQQAGLLRAAPTSDATRGDLITQALAGLTDVDTKGLDHSPAEVPIVAGGEDPAE